MIDCGAAGGQQPVNLFGPAELTNSAELQRNL